MILFLYGQDSYRSRQKLNEIIERYKKIHKTGLNLRYFSGNENKIEDLRNEFRQTAMFREKKLIVLKNTFSNAVFKAKISQLKDLLSDFSKKIDDVILFYEDKEIPKNDSLFKLLKKYGQCQEFVYFSGVKLKDWIKKEFKKYRTEVEEGAMEELISFTGNETWQLSNEIKKLAIFKKGGKIQLKDVRLLIRPKYEVNIFKTIDAVAQKNKRLALSLIHQHLSGGDSPFYIISMINFELRNLLEVKYMQRKGQSYYEASSQKKMHPYIFKKSWGLAEKFTFSELKKIYQKLFQFDIGIKTGKIEAVVGLDILISEI